MTAGGEGAEGGKGGRRWVVVEKRDCVLRPGGGTRRPRPLELTSWIGGEMGYENDKGKRRERERGERDLEAGMLRLKYGKSQGDWSGLTDKLQQQQQQGQCFPQSV
jgi:hypothetical protein